MKITKMISGIGIIWIILWAADIPRLVEQYPFQELQGVKSLSKEVSKIPDFIKEEAGLAHETQGDMEKLLVRELRISWIRSVLLVLSGLIAGFLTLKKDSTGRIITLFLAIGLLLLRIIAFVKYRDYQFLPEYWATRFHYFPVQTTLDISCAFRRNRPPDPKETVQPFRGKLTTFRSEATLGFSFYVKWTIWSMAPFSFASILLSD